MQRRRLFWLLAALVASLALAAAACGGGEEEAEVAPPSPPAEEQPPAPPAPAEEPAPAEQPPAEEPPAGEPSGEQVLRMALGTEPPSIDPGQAADTTSAFIIYNVMDGLVRLDESLQPQPALAERWEASPDGTTYTFHLRKDATWTNGDPVTADDFEYAWKRAVSPELAAYYSYQFYGIVGSADYNNCDPTEKAFIQPHPQAGEPCDPAELRDAVGVRALDDATLEVELTSAQPWFLQQLGHTSFLPVHRATVEQFGQKWTEPENIVTNGPFKLTGWEHDATLTLERNEDWRDADSVELTRVEMRIIPDATTALSAFEAGEVDACEVSSCIPLAETARLRESLEYEAFPSLSTYYYGINLKNVPDVNQRRALAFAIDRQAIVDNVTQGGQVPVSSFTPEGVPGWDVIKQDFLPVTADLEKAKEYLSQAKNPKQKLTLWYNAEGGHKDIAIAIQAQWKKLGLDVTLKSAPARQYQRILVQGAGGVDVYRYGWVGDFVDAINFLELWTCDSGNNNASFCSSEYDKLVEQARGTADNEARYEIYAQLEKMLTGPDGVMAAIPIYQYVDQTLRKMYVQNWTYNLLDQLDLTKVYLTK